MENAEVSADIVIAAEAMLSDVSVQTVYRVVGFPLNGFDFEVSCVEVFGTRTEDRSG